MVWFFPNRTELNQKNLIRFGSILRQKTEWFEIIRTDWFTFGSFQNRIESKNWSVQSNYLQIILIKIQKYKS